MLKNREYHDVVYKRKKFLDHISQVTYDDFGSFKNKILGDAPSRQSSPLRRVKSESDTILHDSKPSFPHISASLRNWHELAEASSSSEESEGKNDSSSDSVWMSFVKQDLLRSEANERVKIYKREMQERFRKKNEEEQALAIREYIARKEEKQKVQEEERRREYDRGLEIRRLHEKERAQELEAADAEIPPENRKQRDNEVREICDHILSNPNRLNRFDVSYMNYAAQYFQCDYYTSHLESVSDFSD